MKDPAPPSNAAEGDATRRPASATPEAADVERRAMEAARRRLTTPKPPKASEPKPVAGRKAGQPRKPAGRRAD